MDSLTSPKRARLDGLYGFVGYVATLVLITCLPPITFIPSSKFHCLSRFRCQELWRDLTTLEIALGTLEQIFNAALLLPRLQDDGVILSALLFQDLEGKIDDYIPKLRFVDLPLIWTTIKWRLFQFSFAFPQEIKLLMSDFRLMEMVLDCLEDALGEEGAAMESELPSYPIPLCNYANTFVLDCMMILRPLSKDVNTHQLLVANFLFTQISRSYFNKYSSYIVRHE